VSLLRREEVRRQRKREKKGCVYFVGVRAWDDAKLWSCNDCNSIRSRRAGRMSYLGQDARSEGGGGGKRRRTPSQEETRRWLEDGEKAREEMVSVGGSST
jgi:hypothetical protein